jgi:hypothetical protein
MKKQFCVAMMVVALVLLTAGMTMAKSPMYLVGTWGGVVSFAGYNGSFYYVDFVFSYEIQEQDFDTGNFYGFEFAGSYPFTGNVSTNKVVTIIVYGGAGEYRIITGKVSGKKMTGTMQHFLPGQVDTGTFTFYKE